MIEELHIDSFKNIHKTNLKFSKLNILAGTNSSGKSSVIQSLLLSSKYSSNNRLFDEYCQKFGPLDQLVCVKSGKRIFSICCKIDEEEYKIEGGQDKGLTEMIPLKFEENLYYLSADRFAQSLVEKSSIGESLNSVPKFGVYGEYVSSYYANHSNKPIQNNKIKEYCLEMVEEGPFLSHHITYWIHRILGLSLNLHAEKQGDDIKTYYKNQDIAFELRPCNLGTGVGYLAKILIVGLSLKENDVMIVENPEIHLHPKAISELTDFFAILAKSGIQVILETHSEHIINKTRYLVFKEKLKKTDISLYYKDISEHFQEIYLNDKGRYVNKEGESMEFPRGFFDANLQHLLEMMG